MKKGREGGQGVAGEASTRTHPVGGPFPELRRFSAVFQKPYGRNKCPTAHPAPSVPRDYRPNITRPRSPFPCSPEKSTDGQRRKGPLLGFLCKGPDEYRVGELRLVAESERGL